MARSRPGNATKTPVRCAPNGNTTYLPPPGSANKNTSGNRVDYGSAIRGALPQGGMGGQRRTEPSSDIGRSGRY